MAAKKKKKTKPAGGRIRHRDTEEQIASPPQTYGPIPGQSGVGRGQVAPQTRRYAFRRS
jgi:hypothetical protein